MIKKKILYIHHGSGIGGAPLSLLYLIEKLDRNLYDPKVIFLTGSDVVELFLQKKIDVKILELQNYLFIHMEPYWYKIYNPLRFISALYNQIFVLPNLIFQILEDEKPDLLHLNSLFLFNWSITSKRLNIPTILHVRELMANGYLGLRKRFISKLVREHCSKVIAISENNLAALNLPSGMSSVIYNFVDFTYFDKDTNSTYSFDNTNTSIIVLYMGGQIKYKGFNVLVDSLDLLSSKCKVVFAGYYNFNEVLKFKNPLKYLKIKKMLHHKNSIFVGISKDIPNLIAKCDIVIFPSTRAHFARPVIEAYAMAKPVVVSDIHGNDEIVIDGKTGFLFKSGSSIDLAKKINYLVSNKQIAHEFGANGFEIAKNKFDATVNMNRIIAIYEDLLADEKY